MNSRLPETFSDQPKDFQVALITMPFFPVNGPSIQIGLLHSITQRAGFPVDSFHLNLNMAAHLPVEFYNVLSLTSGCLIAEWLFAEAAFGRPPMSLEAFLAAFPQEAESLRRARLGIRGLRQICKLLPGYLKECMRIGDWGKYKVIGLSSTFQQNVPSLAIAKRMKEQYPDVKIVFGGANMEGEMGSEYLRAFSFLDYVVTGEGDTAFPALLQRLFEGRSVEDVPGLAFRWSDDIRMNEPAPPIQDLDSLPVPNYDDFFDRRRTLNLPETYLETYLPIETARGCWWGEKHHCTFCGINGLNMKFRAKSMERVLAELSELSARYGLVHFTPTDNILDLKLLKELFVHLQESSQNYRFFWEIKSNLSREQIRTLFLGGVRVLQPGIDALNTSVLQLMRKGCTMLQNLVAIKWCRYYGIHTLWNLLHGFPGERPEDYANQFRILRLISHLEPPLACVRIDLERYAPYFFDRENFPVTKIRPKLSYSYVYPPYVDLEKIAYFFDYEMGNTVPEAVFDETRAWLARWRRKWLSGHMDSLTFHREKEKVVIHDRRAMLRASGQRLGNYEFSEPAASIYELCSDRYRTVCEITSEIRNKGLDPSPKNPVNEILRSFCTSGIMVNEDEKYLALALPRPFPPAVSPIGDQTSDTIILTKDVYSFET